jgi:hypothetical protein
LVAPSLDSIVGVKVVVTLAEVICSMGEAIARFARRAARRDMMRRLMEGIVILEGLTVRQVYPCMLQDGGLLIAEVVDKWMSDRKWLSRIGNCQTTFRALYAYDMAEGHETLTA